MKELIKFLVAKMLPKYVTLDGRDGTITVSKYMYTALRLMGADKSDRIYMFCLIGSPIVYAFAVNPQQLDGVNTSFATLQYNGMTKTIGFAPACPTVAQVMYDYDMPHDAIRKVTVTAHKAKGLYYFKLERI